MNEKFSYKNLSPRERALLAIAVLIDGADATYYLDNDSVNRQALIDSVQDFLRLDNEYRLPVLASVLRRALKELEGV